MNILEKRKTRETNNRLVVARDQSVGVNELTGDIVGSHGNAMCLDCSGGKLHNYTSLSKFIELYF